MNSALFFFFAVIPAVFAFNVNRENSKLFKQAVDKTGPDHPLLNLVQVQPKPSSSNSRSISHTRTERLQGPPNYWFHPKIHTFGNTGVFGALHAAIAPLATKLIDAAAYSGENVRVQAARNLRKRVAKSGANVLDLCCGVGISTRALRTAFHDANALLGIDTSPEMFDGTTIEPGKHRIPHPKQRRASPPGRMRCQLYCRQRRDNVSSPQVFRPRHDHVRLPRNPLLGSLPHTPRGPSDPSTGWDSGDHRYQPGLSAQSNNAGGRTVCARIQEEYPGPTEIYAGF